MRLLIVFMTGILIFGIQSAEAQQPTVLDGFYVKEHTPGRKPIGYAQGALLREANVMWSKRIWRQLDLRQKINHPLFYPTKPIQDRMNLFDVIVNAITVEGTLSAYNPGTLGNNDEFTEPFTVDEIKNMMFWVDTQLTPNLETGELQEVLVEQELKSEDIYLYKIKEDWFFDRERSVMDVRIIGICPMREERTETGEFKGHKAMFWIYFPEARYVFANAEVFNPGNDAERRTYEDIFWKRQFGSYIIKESNVYDRSIIEYKAGLDQLLEAEKIKEEIFNTEHDLWSF